MDKQIFQIPGYIVRDKSMNGGGRQFVIETQEALNPEMVTRLISLENKLGWFTFSVDVIEAVDIKPLINKKIDAAKYDKGKSPSQRLRSVLYLIHQATGGTKENFQQYYDSIMEQLINKYKDKLGELQ